VTRTYFISNCSWQNTKVGNGYYLNGLFSLDERAHYFSLISINPNSTFNNKKERSFFYKEKIFLPLRIINVFIYFTFSFIVKSARRNNHKYILSTSTLEYLNFFLIKKYKIRIYLMIDSLFDDYFYSGNRVKNVFSPLAYIIECLYIISGLKRIILNSEIVEKKFKSRYSLLLRIFKVEVLNAGIWIDDATLNLVEKQISNNKYFLIHGNFEFNQNLNGIEDLAASIYKNKKFVENKIGYNLVIAGKSAERINEKSISYFRLIFKSVEVWSNPPIMADFIKHSSGVIVASTEANGPKIKVLESCLSGKITLAHKNVVSFYPDGFPNLIKYKNFKDFYNILISSKEFQEVQITEEVLHYWSKKNKVKDLMKKLNL
jgi:hypothetical protein